MYGGPQNQPKVIVKNVPLGDANAKYVKAMALVEDHSNTIGHKLYVMKKTNNGTVKSQLGYFNIVIDQGGIIPPSFIPEVDYTARYTSGDIQITPDGGEMDVAMTNSVNFLFFSIPTIEGNVYDLTTNYQVQPTAVTGFIDSFAKTSSMDVTYSGDHMYYSFERPNANKLIRFNTRGAANGQFLINGKKTVRRQANGNMIVAGSLNGDYELKFVNNPDLLTPLIATNSNPYPLPSSISKPKFRAHFALQAHRIYITGNTYTRCVGEKFYEIKDHLGNVRTVITDINYMDAIYAQTLDNQDVFLEFNDINYNLNGWSAYVPAGCGTSVQSTVSANGLLELAFPTSTGNCVGSAADFNFQTVIGTTYTVKMQLNRENSPNVEIKTIDHVSGNTITTSISGSNIQPGVVHPYVEYSFIATSVESKLRFLSSGQNDPIIAMDYLIITSEENHLADIVSYTDYYPYGMLMPGRNHSGDGYRYGFQGQEKDDEIKGEGNSINYKYRMHDPRLGRFFAVDPLSDDYPHNSPYAFSENRIIDAIELEGKESDLVFKQGIRGPNNDAIPLTPTSLNYGKSAAPFHKLFNVRTVYVSANSDLDKIRYQNIQAKIANFGIPTNDEISFMTVFDKATRDEQDRIRGRQLVAEGRKNFARVNNVLLLATELSPIGVMQDVGELVSLAMDDPGLALMVAPLVVLDLGDVAKINNRFPRNYKWAGQTYTFKGVDAKLATKYSEGVKFNKEGFPDFSPFKENEVNIGSLMMYTSSDISKANKMAGYTNGTPAGMVWHHVENSTILQLIPKDLHDAVKHTGGRATDAPK
jgi:RHS repeat-associated protein